MVDQSSADRAESASATIQRIGGEHCSETEPLQRRRVADETVDDELAVFKALANENRLRIVEALREGELCVCELETVLDAPQSTVASHLSQLREAGIVRARKQGKWTYYRIADTASVQLVDLARALGEDE
ncbi:ArsR/SmtB family transcription factor [Natronobacterium gregoryi]|uniref:Transcriptional regulator n=2 Tax=Natronobacterium gregoryi TaxID=44930 RepID=L0AL68_NATGS|nr:metalloregulator ArsR/SmtB family transcription factor [Natronobacterium gregoryi]AFZ74184.1 putative transcriptional regulator [Natronobacterium gregoryi SP2]ELY63640.1 ArsR family transcriptional regulator [Natronobacterium gregoryi SP2]PLK22094.1 ArsR family transcriptional regulator [Natronobacterium gregoryi SP2]SFI51052.1 transcriptional regulator, ArsR family [Natronobacterium gregoryi]